jgi:hypothetical protein
VAFSVVGVAAADYQEEALCLAIAGSKIVAEECSGNPDQKWYVSSFDPQWDQTHFTRIQNVALGKYINPVVVDGEFQLETSSASTEEYGILNWGFHIGGGRVHGIWGLNNGDRAWVSTWYGHMTGNGCYEHDYHNCPNIFNVWSGERLCMLSQDRDQPVRLADCQGVNCHAGVDCDFSKTDARSWAFVSNAFGQHHAQFEIRLVKGGLEPLPERTTTPFPDEMTGYEDLGNVHCIHDPRNIEKETFKTYSLVFCAFHCDQTPGCVGFAFSKSREHCYVKSEDCQNPVPSSTSFRFYTRRAGPALVV